MGDRWVPEDTGKVVHHHHNNNNNMDKVDLHLQHRPSQLTDNSLQDKAVHHPLHSSNKNMNKLNHLQVDLSHKMVACLLLRLEEGDRHHHLRRLLLDKSHELDIFLLFFSA